MDRYQTILIAKGKVSQETFLFTFKKPSNFTFKAGQYCDFYLPSVPKSDTETGIRSLSLANAPWEENLTVIIRFRPTTFKHKLLSLNISDPVEFSGPNGTLILPDAIDKRSLVFLAGGIGITPFFSLIKQAQKQNFPQPIHLFYSNATPATAVFLQELNTIRSPKFKLILTMTRDPFWSGLRGRINSDLLKKLLPNFSNNIFYIAGAPTMVADLKQLLKSLGVKNQSLRTEDFTGYD